MSDKDESVLEPLFSPPTRSIPMSTTNNKRQYLTDALNAELVRAQTFVTGLRATVSAIQEAIALSRAHINSSRDLMQSPIIGPGDAHHPDGLTSRERQVLKPVAKGETNKAIGRELGISMKTVEFHRSNGVRKLGLGGRTDIVRYAITRRWL